MPLSARGGGVKGSNPIQSLKMGGRGMEGRKEAKSQIYSHIQM